MSKRRAVNGKGENGEGMVLAGRLFTQRKRDINEEYNATTSER